MPTSRSSLGLLPDSTSGSYSHLSVVPDGSMLASSNSKQAVDNKPALPRKPRRFLTVQVQPQHLTFLTDKSAAADAHSQSNPGADRPSLPQKHTLAMHKPDQPETLL